MAEPPGTTRDVFTEWFALADADKDDRVSGQEAVSFFTKFDQLVKKDLIECWEIADEYKRGFLTLREFKVAMGVVSLKQAGVREITAAHVQLLRSGETRGLPTPVLKSGERLGESPSVVGGGAPSSSSSGGNEAAAANGAMEQRQKQQQQQKEVSATTTTMTSGRLMLSDDIFAAYDQPPPPQTSGGGFDGFNAAGGAGFDGGFTATGPSVGSFSNDAFGSAPSSSAAPAGFHAHPSTSSDLAAVSIPIFNRHRRLRLSLLLRRCLPPLECMLLRKFGRQWDQAITRDIKSSFYKAQITIRTRRFLRKCALR